MIAAILRLPLQAIGWAADRLVQAHDTQRACEMAEELNRYESQRDHLEPGYTIQEVFAKRDRKWDNAPDPTDPASYGITFENGSPYQLGVDIVLGPRYVMCPKCWDTHIEGDPCDSCGYPNTPPTSPTADASSFVGDLPSTVYRAALGNAPVADSDIPPSSPVTGASTWIEFAAPVIVEVLAQHHGWYAYRNGGYRYYPCACGFDGAYDSRDLATEHVAPLIAAALESACLTEFPNTQGAPKVENGQDMGGLWAAEMFPQHTKRPQ